ncbi:hypothetical protein Godav_019784 [Gossypium davidsonii]|uniref:DUF4283 domain-containing protein n=1 Tax=Gossypium davidsonii TaxID=34287 RepID=A0A7J8R1P7_GOSDV|nr:hypothetical protein [Gossypium davidsonii]
MERDDISLLEEELVHLTVKSSPVVSSGNPTLLGTFDDEEDLELILARRPWLFRQNLVIFKKLDKAMERSNLHLVEFPFWLKIGSCPPECENKDLTHAIGSTFEGIISSEINGDFCRIKVELDVQKPLRRGIFIMASIIKLDGEAKYAARRKYEEINDAMFLLGKRKWDWERLEDLGSLFVGKVRGKRAKLVAEEFEIEENIFQRGAEGTKSGLCLAKKEEVDIILRSFSRNYIDVMVKSKEVDLK